MQSDPLNEQFRRRLLDAQVEPPDDMWARVAERLRQERKAIPLRWSSWGIRMAAGLALLLGLTWCLRLAIQPQPLPQLAHSEAGKPASQAEPAVVSPQPKAAHEQKGRTGTVSAHSATLYNSTVQASPKTTQNGALSGQGPSVQTPPASLQQPTLAEARDRSLTLSEPLISSGAMTYLPLRGNATLPQRVILLDTRPVWVLPPVSGPGDVVPSKWACGLTSTAGATHTSNLSAAFQQQVLVWDTLGISSNGSQPASRDVVATLSYPTAKISTGLQFEYLLGAGWGIQSGIGITRNTLTTATALQGAEALGLSNRNNNLSQDDYSVIAQNSTRAVSTQLAVPVLLNKYFKKGRSSLLLSGGIQVQRLISRQPKVNYILVDALNNPATVFEANNLPQNTPEVLPEMALGALMRIQYQYQLNERWALHGGPSLLVNATPAFNIDGINGRAPLAAGLEIGLKYYPSADSR